MQALVRLFLSLSILIVLSVESIAQSSIEDSIPVLRPSVMPDAHLLFNKLLDKDATSFEGIFVTGSDRKKQEEDSVYVVRLPAMTHSAAIDYVKNELPTTHRGRTLTQSYVLECEQKNHKCELYVHLHESELTDKPIAATYEIPIILELEAAKTDESTSTSEAFEGNARQENTKRQSEEHCEAGLPCPSPTVDSTEISEAKPTITNSDLPDVEADWYEKLYIFQNMQSSDTLVLRQNIVYYSGKSLPLLLDLLNSLLFYAGTIDTSFGYYGHFANTQVLAEILALGDHLPTIIKDHNLVLVSPQVDATGYSLAAAIYVTYKYYWNDLVLDKKHMSQSDVRVFFAWKLFANVATKAVSQFGENRLFADESDPEVRKMKASVFTSLVTAMPYGAKLVASVLTGRNYANHLLKAIPADHLLSCSISTSGNCLQLFFHRLLGDADLVTIPATATEPAKQVQAGLAYIPSAITQATIGQVCKKAGLTVVAGHYTKGAGYALIDGVDKYLVAQGASDLKRYSVLSGGALIMSATNYQYSKAFATGFSNRYAKYMMLYAATAIVTAMEFVFYTSIFM
ncbi:hypothetical protein [Endozoicomonas arenosclerae]|uniref:hypothetical protein n=1 Tax=Endozoicomonas arenosclerae TaxID=1633495 RepID=UPI0007808EB7|nr:hypothetical protein [Endozoicomonas arenosclerae]